MNIPSSTIGILYPGEMGVCVGSLLLSRGFRVITALSGRSAATASRADSAGIETVSTLADLVREARIVFSIVPPAAAGDAAEQYCEFANHAPPEAIFIETNSIGPELAATIAGRVEAAGVACVDAAINGLAKNLTTSATLMLSGSRAGEVQSLFGDAMRVRVLGARIGSASAMKMLLSGLSKGVCALYLEAALVADQFGMLAEMNESYATIYPGIMALVERMLPTYSLHAGRRADEMRQMEQTVLSAGLQPVVFAAIREAHERLAAADFHCGAAGLQTAAELVKILSAGGFQ